MGSALRSYLALYSFVPLCLCLKGPFFNFSFFWRTINSPSSQVFLHPITMEILWDVRFPADMSFSANKLKEFLGASAEEFGRGNLPIFNDEVLNYEIKNLGASPNGRLRYSLSWGQVLFLPTRLDRPRRQKKARGIRKRLAKRLVRSTGRRFWAN